MKKRLCLISPALIAGITLCGCQDAGIGSRTGMDKAGKPWPIWDVAFSPDGRWLAAGRGYHEYIAGGEGEVVVWQTKDWEQQAEFRAPFTNMAKAIAFTSDGKHLIAASDKYNRNVEGSGNPRKGNVVFIWTFPDGMLAKTLAFDDRQVNRGAGSVASMTLSPDGEYLGLGRVGSVSIVLQGMTSRRLYDLKGNIGTYQSCAFSPAGKVLGSITHLKPRIRLCDAVNGGELASFDLKETKPCCLAFSSDGKQIAVGDTDGSIHLLAADFSKQLRSIQVSDGKEKVQALAYAAKADLLAAATTIKVRLFEASTGKQLQEWGKADLEVLTVALSPDGKLLAVGYGGKHNAEGEQRGGYVNIWDTATGRLVKKLD